MSRRITLTSIIGILCVALLLNSGSANVVCHKEGHCPDAKACFSYCVERPPATV
ncbi:hypothetical protein DEO72_LG11g2579 [Vigna unguiculata]|uniref:Uncharacterized protein n=1 Tax=Vigna unguiculata TaxID=3917 RepID=A0A4D6NQC3_VIGUN|nr:hypothetical protein DEO72_LG11g2579 [Vigna unguiculata]